LDELLGSVLGNEVSGMVEHFYQEFPPPDAPAADWDTDPGTPAESTVTAPGTPL
jgi:penicillin-binding protein 1A